MGRNCTPQHTRLASELQGGACVRVKGRPGCVLPTPSRWCLVLRFLASPTHGHAGNSQEPGISQMAQKDEHGGLRARPQMCITHARVHTHTHTHTPLQWSQRETLLSQRDQFYSIPARLYKTCFMQIKYVSSLPLGEHLHGRLLLWHVKG